MRLVKLVIESKWTSAFVVYCNYNIVLLLVIEVWLILV